MKGRKRTRLVRTPIKNGVPVRKLEAARRQLETAIELFLQDKDFISVHSLAANARGILLDLASARGLHKGVIQFIRDEFKDSFEDALREPQNFFKHGAKDPDEEFSYPSNLTSVFLYDAVELYFNIAGNDTPEKLKVIRGYFAWEHPEMLNAEGRSAHLALKTKWSDDPITKADWLRIFNS